MDSATKLPDGEAASDPQPGVSASAATTGPGRARRWLGAVYNHLFRIRYRLLLINLIVVAVPIAGIGFARTFETEMLRSLENDMIHQAQLLREALVDDPQGLRLSERGPLLARAARHTRTRIRLLDERGRVMADSHAKGPPEGAERPVPGLFGDGADSYHPPETPEPVDASNRREVRVALAGGYGSATRLWENRGRVYLFSALPIRTSAKASGEESPVLGAVYVTRSTAPVKFAMLRLRTWLFVVFVAAIFLTAILSLFLAATIARPLGRLTRIAGKIAAGDRRETLAMRRRDEIGQLARAFDTMTRRLDERARDRSELAANISHEFKSPLTSIRGAAELLLDGAADDPPARDKFLRNILEDTHRLDRLVTRLLELARFESDTAHSEVFDYEALVREVAARRLDGAATESDAMPGEADGEKDGVFPAITVSYRCRVTHVPGRRAHLASALGNLLDNALQHAEPGTTVTVQVSDGPAGCVRTAVHNSGPAISESTRARLWDRFFTTRGKRGGTGLGLAIVASVIKAHAGSVAVSSTEADGTTFSYDLPSA